MAYDKKYNGNVIYYDPYQTINATTALGKIKNSALEQSELIAQDDQYFNNVPERYSCLIPNPRYDGQKPYIDGLVTDGYDAAIATLSSVTNAIIDYCNEDGVFTAESKAVLDSYLRKKGGSGGDSGGVFGDSSGTLEDTEDIKLEANNEEVNIRDSEINKVIPENGGNLSAGEEIVISEVAGTIGAGVTGGVVGGAIGSGILSSTEQEELLNSFSTSLLGAGVSVPSPVASSLEKLSKSGVIGPAALAVFAATGVGSKVFYDKKRDNDDEEDDADILELNKKSGSNISSAFISGSSVALKHNLLEAGEVLE